MRASTLATFTVCLILAPASIGCGGRSDLVIDAPFPDGSVLLDDGAVASPDTAPADAGECVPQCQTDLECQLSCAPLDAGQANCCDRQTATCYQFEGTTCPHGGRRDGGGVPPY